MCSRLHQESIGPTSPGGEIEFVPAGETAPRRGTWGAGWLGRGGRPVGFARVESFQAKWLAKGWKTGRVPIADFAEGHGEGQRWAGLPSGANVACLWKQAPDGSVNVVLLTRQATATERAALNHHRVLVRVQDGRLVLPQKGGESWK